MGEAKKIPMDIFMFKWAIHEGRMKLNQIATEEYSHEALYSEWEM